MLIVNVTTSDPAGAIIRQAQCINRYTDSVSRVLITRDLGFGWPVDLCIGQPATIGRESLDVLKTADVVVLHKPIELAQVKIGETDQTLLAAALALAKKTVIYHHGEGTLRLKPADIIEFEKDIPGLRVVVTPDLLRMIPGAKFIPNVIDAGDYIPCRSVHIYTPIVSQCTTGNWNKDGDWLIDVLKDANQNLPPFTFKVFHSMKWDDCLRGKRLSAVGIDHFQGYYGLSGLEYAAFGIPVLVGLDSWNAGHLREFFDCDTTPFLITPKERFIPQLRSLLNDEAWRQDCGRLARDIMRQIWTGKYVAEKLIKIYEETRQ